MNEASSDRRKRAALAISSGRPVRPSGTDPPARRRTRSSGSMPAVDFWSGRATNTRSIGVSIGPGHTAFTRIFSGARRTDRLLTKPTTPNLHIEYTGLYEEPCSPEVDAVKSRLPPPRRRISGMAVSVVTRTVRRLSSMARSNAFMSMPSTAAGPGCPTWFHTKSRPLKRAAVSHTMRRESSSFVRSATIPCAVPPAALISPTTRSTPGASTSTTATWAPSRAKRSAPARPMPEAAAVTIPIFPASRMSNPPRVGVREGPSLHPAAEALEPEQLVAVAGIGGVEPARVGEHEHARGADALALGPGPAPRGGAEEGAVDGDAHEGHHLGARPPD